MDTQNIIRRLSAEEDTARRTTLFNELCGNDQRLMWEVAESLAAKNLTLDAAVCPPKPVQNVQGRVQPEAGQAIEPPGGLGGLPPTTTAPHPTSLIETLGRYRLLEILGEGGMGTVYLAQQSEPVNRRVAIKVTKAGIESPELIARFQAERQALALMDHESIARVFDADTTEDGRQYLVMELVKGVPITSYCDDHKLTIAARLRLLASVCRAIQHAHQKGIIHRDLKPSNILVAEADGLPVPKVIDFGLAKAMQHQLSAETPHTQFGQVLGTLEYMSPEQAHFSALDVDTRTDVYSLGVILYELLTGTTPLTRERLKSAALDEILRSIREEEPTRPSSRLSESNLSLAEMAGARNAGAHQLPEMLRGDLDSITMKALAKDRNRRYDSAASLADDLQRYLNDEPIEARAPSAGYLVKKFAKRHRGLVASLAAVLVALTLGIGFSVYFALRAANERDLAQRELIRANEVKRVITDTLYGITPKEAKGADTTLLKGILDNTSQRLAEGEVTDERIAGELHEILGKVYTQLGFYDRGEEHLQAALDIRRQTMGEYDLGTLSAMHNLGFTFTEHGKYAEAEPLLTEALKGRTEVLGERHPDTIRAMRDLGGLYIVQRRDAEAEAMLKKALELTEQDQDVGHLQAMNRLGTMYSQSRQLDEAEPLLESSWQGIRELLGPAHPTTLMASDRLAQLYFRLERFDQAESLHLETLAATKTLFGDEHPNTIGSMNNLAMVYEKLDRHDEAVTMYLAVLDAATRQLGDEHPKTLGTMTNLGNTYIAMEEYDKAREVFESVVPTKRRVLGESHPWTQYAITGLLLAYEGLDRHDEALPLRRELFDLAVTPADAEDATARQLDAAADRLLTEETEEWRDAGRARAFAQRACKLEEAEGGKNLHKFLRNLALAQHMTGDTALAIETQQRAIELTPQGDASIAETQEELEQYQAALE